MDAALILGTFTGVVNCVEITPPSSEPGEITTLLVNFCSKSTAMTQIRVPRIGAGLAGGDACLVSVGGGGGMVYV